MINRIEKSIELNAPIEKVWRALSVPEIRQAWLGEPDAGPAEVAGSRAGERLDLVWPTHGGESLVSFEVSPAEGGGARLVITHRAPQTALFPPPLPRQSDREPAAVIVNVARRWLDLYSERAVRSARGRNLIRVSRRSKMCSAAAMSRRSARDRRRSLRSGPWRRSKSWSSRRLPALAIARYWEAAL